MIRQGRVKLNGRPVQVGDKMDTAKDLISVDGRNIRVPKKQEFVYEMLYKPRGYITTMSDERGRKTVMELVKDVPARIFPIGRLDKDSEGLLLFTNDGEFANLMMHPSHGVSKLYRVTVRPRASEAQLAELAAGVTLDDGEKTQPAGVRVMVDEPEPHGAGAVHPGGQKPTRSLPHVRGRGSHRDPAQAQRGGPGQAWACCSPVSTAP